MRIAREGSCGRWYGFAHQLRAGDWVTTVGGTHAGRQYKRFRFEDTVVQAGQTKGQRTRGHVVFERVGHWQLHTWCPVRFIRTECGDLESG